MSSPELATPSLGERVDAVLRAQGIRCALIGAGAMAVHGYVQAARDVCNRHGLGARFERMLAAARIE